MHLYLIRHAEAVPLGDRGIKLDEDRPLTEAGITQAKILGTVLNSHGINFDRVATSPLLRARETADLLVPAWSPAPEVEQWPELAPHVKPRRLAKLLRTGEGRRVGLVGHQPDLATFAAWLIGSKQAQIDIAKGGVALIDCAEGLHKGGGTLLWLLTPQWLKGE